MTSRSSIRQTLRAAILLSVAAILAEPASCHAAFLIESPNVSSAPGLTGSFDILLVNTGPTALNVAGDSVEIALTGVSGGSFTAATISTTAAPYLYTKSGTLGPPASPLSFSLFPNTTFLASDSEFGSLGSRVIAPGDTYGLVHVSFAISSSATASVGTLSFLDLGTGTSLADTVGNSIAFTTRTGTFTIVASAAVPEPKSVVMLWIGGVGLALVGGSQRLKRGRGTPPIARVA